jgi:hypothetical protein
MAWGWPRAFVLLSVIAALALAGCGGSSGPTRSQYVAKANVVCADARTQTAPLIASLKSAIGSLLSGGSEKPLVRIATRLDAVAAATLARLRSIKQPGSDHTKIAAFLTPLTAVVADLGQLARAVAAGDTTGALAALERQQATKAKVVRSAHSYGLGRCSTLLAAAS